MTDEFSYDDGNYFGDESNSLSSMSDQQNAVEPTLVDEPLPIEENVETVEEEEARNAYSFKVNGEDVNKELSDTDYHTLAQKGLAYDQSMSALDLEKKSLSDKQNEFATEKGEAEQFVNQGKVLEQVRQSNPEKYQEIANIVNGIAVEANKPQESDLEKQANDLIAQLEGDESLKEMPVFNNMATVIKTMSSAIKNSDGKTNPQVEELLAEIQELKNRNQTFDKQQADDNRNKEIGKLNTWLSERGIDPQDPNNVEDMRRVGYIMNDPNVSSLIQSAEIVFKGSVIKEPETETRQVEVQGARTVPQKRTSGLSRTQDKGHDSYWGNEPKRLSDFA